MDSKVSLILKIVIVALFLQLNSNAFAFNVLHDASIVHKQRKCTSEEANEWIIQDFPFYRSPINFAHTHFFQFVEMNMDDFFGLPRKYILAYGENFPSPYSFIWRFSPVLYAWETVELPILLKSGIKYLLASLQNNRAAVFLPVSKENRSFSSEMWILNGTNHWSKATLLGGTNAQYYLDSLAVRVASSDSRPRQDSVLVANAAFLPTLYKVRKVNETTYKIEAIESNIELIQQTFGPKHANMSKTFTSVVTAYNKSLVIFSCIVILPGTIKIPLPLLQYNVTSNSWSFLDGFFTPSVSLASTLDGATGKEIILVMTDEGFAKGLAVAYYPEKNEHQQIRIRNSRLSLLKAKIYGTIASYFGKAVVFRFDGRLFRYYTIRQINNKTWVMAIPKVDKGRSGQFKVNLLYTCKARGNILAADTSFEKIYIFNKNSWNERGVKFPSEVNSLERYPFYASHSEEQKNSCVAIVDKLLHRYNYHTNRWTVSSLPTSQSRLLHSSVKYFIKNDFYLLQFGGVHMINGSSEIITLNPAIVQICSYKNETDESFQCWNYEQKTSALISSRFGHAAFVSNNSMYIFGGLTFKYQNISGIYNETSEILGLNDLWVYDIVKKIWKELKCFDHKCPPSLAFASVVVNEQSAVIAGISRWAISYLREKIRSNYSGDFKFKKVLDLSYSSPLTQIGIWIFYFQEETWLQVTTEFYQSENTFLFKILPWSDNSVAVITARPHRLEQVPFNWQYVASRLYVAVLKPGCELGYFSANVLKSPCKICEKGTYSESRVSKNCTRCPSGFTTATNGSTEVRDCTVCDSMNYCQYGLCKVTIDSNTTNLERYCQCQVGYSGDRCTIPVALIATLSSAGGTLILVLGTSVVIYLLRSRRGKQELLDKKEKERRALERVWNISFSDITMKERIGNGGYGEVHRAEYRDTMIVAIKKLSDVHLGFDEIERDFAREIEFLKTVRHPNIVLFLGAGVIPEYSCPFLLMEFITKGSLGSILRNQDEPMSYRKKLICCLQTVKALKYLHSELTPPRAHRDLKSDNLLVSENWIVKLADFGFARLVEKEGKGQSFGKSRLRRTTCSTGQSEGVSLLQERELMSRGFGTFQWNAPEVLAGECCGTSSDIYSFGIVMFELWEREIPYHDRNETKFTLAEKIIAGLRPSVHDSCPTEFEEIMQRCWMKDPDGRPKASELTEEIETVLSEL